MSLDMPTPRPAIQQPQRAPAQQVLDEAPAAHQVDDGHAIADIEAALAEAQDAPASAVDDISLERDEYDTAAQEREQLAAIPNDRPAAHDAPPMTWRW